MRTETPLDQRDPSRAESSRAESSRAESSRETLDARAKALAMPLADDIAGSNATDAVVLNLDGERYAIEARYVLEIVPLAGYAPLPADAKAFALVNWRGSVLTVLDLRDSLHVASNGDAPDRHVVVLGRARAEIGIVVDGVSELRRIDPEVLQAPPNDRGRPGWVRGVTPDAIVTLDAPALLDAVEEDS